MRALLLVSLAACGMYNAPADPLHKVKPLPPPVVKVEPVVPHPQIETCTALFHDGAKVKRAPTIAQQKVGAGDAKIAAADKEPVVGKKVTLFTDGIDNYRAALVADPFDADATVALARAYDQVWRKGCALKLLDRLAILAQNPKISPKAKQAVQDVQDHDEWFKDYRSAAKDAVLGVRNP